MIKKSFTNILNYGADPWSIPLELFKRTILASAPQDVVWNRPGISNERDLGWDEGSSIY